MRSRIAVCLLAFGALAACSSDDDGSPANTAASDGAVESPEDSSGDVSPDETDETVAPTTDPGDDVATSSDPPASTTPATTVPPGPTPDGPRPFPQLGPATISVATPTAGGGLRPELEWDAVDGAAEYSVVLATADGATYWSWSGAETAVPVGGAPPLADGAPGPEVADGMFWYVLALDADGVLIGQSELLPIAP